MSVKNYQELVVWQRAMDLVEMIYRVTAGFPKEEVYTLTSQIRRAAISVPSNIAEGQGRSTTRDFLYFLSIANGSLKEVETQILIAERLQYIDKTTCTTLLDLASEVGRIMKGLQRSLKQKDKTH